MSLERPVSVPERATFNQEGNNWEAGERDGEGKKVGQWEYWRPDGSLECEEQWGDGRTKLSYRRFHPDGRVSQSGAKDLVRDLWVGAMRWTKIEVASPEDKWWPSAKHPALRTYELTIDDDGWVIAEHLFGEGGERRTPTGALFPEIPEGIPANAILVNLDQGWLAQTRSLDNQRRRGAYGLWDRNGVLQERHHYEENGDSRQEKFRAGKLSSTLELRGGEKVQTFYRNRRGGEPVITSSTRYRNDGKDRETTIYDDGGARQYSVRMEEVAPGHLRRYDDGALVLEAIWTPDSEAPPAKVEYYGPEGELLIDYQSLGGGRGELRLHKDGQLEILPTEDEVSNNRYGHWGKLLPGFAHYEHDREQRDWEIVEARFRHQLEAHRFTARVAAQVIPEALAPILARFDWASTRSADRDARIDKLLAMMVSAEEADAERAREHLWGAVEEQDCVFAASYATAETLARMVPLAERWAQPAAGRRGMKLLADLVVVPALAEEDPDRFEEVRAAVREVAPQLGDAVRTADDALGCALLHLFSTVGEPSAIAARLRDPAASVAIKAFAACCALARRGMTAEERGEVLRLLRQVFAEETDAGVKAVTGVLVKLGSGGAGGEDGEADDAEIDAHLAHFLLHPAERPALYPAWRPVIRFLSEDISSMLMRAVPERVRLRELDGLLDRLPRRGSLLQVSDLDILFETLFPDGAEQELTPLHRKALRTAAAVVDEHPGFVNHGEVFRKHGLPWSSFELRQLADAGGAGDAEPKQ